MSRARLAGTRGPYAVAPLSMPQWWTLRRIELSDWCLRGGLQNINSPASKRLPHLTALGPNSCEKVRRTSLFSAARAAADSY
jgi:hypothetical protein